MKLNCSLQYIKMRKNKRYDENKALLDLAENIDSDTVINQRFLNMTFEDDIVGISFDNCQFINCTFKCKIKNTTFFNVKFSKCEISNIYVINSGFHYSVFADSHMVGINFIDSILKVVDVNNCHMKLSQFSSVIFDDVLFKETNLCDLNISDCNFKDSVIFDKCEMLDMEVRGSNLVGVDVSTSRIDGIKCDIKLIRGLIVSEVQAIELINLMGVVIK